MPSAKSAVFVGLALMAFFELAVPVINADTHPPWRSHEVAAASVPPWRRSPPAQLALTAQAEPTRPEPTPKTRPASRPEKRQRSDDSLAIVCAAVVPPWRAQLALTDGAACASDGPLALMDGAAETEESALTDGAACASAGSHGRPVLSPEAAARISMERMACGRFIQIGMPHQTALSLVRRMTDTMLAASMTNDSLYDVEDILECRSTASSSSALMLANGSGEVFIDDDYYYESS